MLKNKNPLISPKYNGGLDFWKLIFTLVIVLHHAGKVMNGGHIFPNGARAVEFFFILSGYFMAVSAGVYKLPQKPLGQDTAKFIFRKLTAIIPYYLFAFTANLAVFLVSFFQKAHSPAETVDKLSHILPNLLLLQATGLKQTNVMGVSWYISAMLFAMALIYPILRKYRDIYINVIAPLSALLLMGYMSKKYGNLILSYELDVYFTRELMRAILGINIGCTVYTVSKKLSSISLTKISKVLLCITEFSLYISAILGMIYMDNSYVFIILFMFFAAVTITASKQSILAPFFDNKYIKATNRFSLAIYLCHSPIRTLSEYLSLDLSVSTTIILFLISSALLAVVCMLTVHFFTKINRRYGSKIKAVFIKETA